MTFDAPAALDRTLQRLSSPAALWAFLLLLATLLLGQWVQSRIQAVREGRFAEPVSVMLSGPSSDAAIKVQRVNTRGKVEAIAQLPQRLSWTSGPIWFSHLRVSMPQAALAQLQAATVQIGNASFVVSGDEIRSTWTRTDTGKGVIALQSPKAIRSERSRIGAFDRFINWPGDTAMLKSLAFDAHTYRLLLALSLLGLMRLHTRASSPRKAQLERFARVGTAVVLSGFTLLVLLPMFWTRATFVLSTEHLEGVQAACTYIWSQQGGDLYSAPTIDGSGNIYSPGYYFVSRVWGDAFGFSLPSLRGLTWFCNLLSAAAAIWVLSRLGALRSAWLWVPLYLATFCFSGWIDNANKDALHICLSMLGFACMIASLEGQGLRASLWPALGGALWALAFMTKQSHVAVVAPTFLFFLFRARKQLFYAASSCGLLVLVLTLWSVDTWPLYWEWTVVIPSSHKFLWEQLLATVGIVLAMLSGYFVIAALWLQHEAPITSDNPGLLASNLKDIAYSCIDFALGGLVMGCMSAGKDRGGDYALLPGLAALCIPVAGAFAAPLQGRAAMLFPLLLLVLNWPMAYAVGPQDRAAAERLVAALANEPGEVWVPLEAYANVAAQKRAYVPSFCAGEWTAAGRPFPREVLDPIRQQRFGLIVTQYNWPERIGAPQNEEPFATIAKHYELSEVLPRDQAYSAKDGWRNSMRLLWRPKRK